MIMMHMENNFWFASQCSTAVMHMSFYIGVVALDKVTNQAQKVKWSNFLQNNRQNILEERIFLCKVVDFIIETFATDPTASDASHSFDHFKQASDEPVSDYVKNASVLATQDGKLLFADQPVETGRSELAKNLSTLIHRLYNEKVIEIMNDFILEFMGRAPTEKWFTDRLRDVVIARREDLIKEKVTERNRLLGLRYDNHEKCLVDLVDGVEVDGGAIAVFGPNSGVAKGRPELNNLFNYMLCRRCSLGAHAVGQCTARVGEKNAVNPVISESPAEFDEMMKLFFRRQNDRKYNNSQGGRGAFNQNGWGGFNQFDRGCGGRGSYQPCQRIAFNAVVQEDGAIEEYLERKLYEEDPVTEKQSEENVPLN